MKHLKRILWVVAVLAMIAAFSAVAMAETEVTSITFSKTSYEVAYGQSLSLSDPEYITVKGDCGTLTWSTSAAMTVSVDKDTGYVTGNNPGKATITVKGEKGGSATTEVVVKDNPVKTITISPTALTVDKNSTVYFDVYVTHADEEATFTKGIKDITFTSSDSSIAYNNYWSYSNANQEGQMGVKGVDEGTATITAYITNLDGSIVTCPATVTVNKPALTSMKFARDKYTVKWPQDKTLKLNVKPVGTSVEDDDVSFVSSDEQIASVHGYVDDEGIAYCYVEPNKPGTITVTATYEPDPTITATTTVVVEAKAMKKLSLNRTAITLSDIRTTYNKGIEFRVEPSGAYYDRKETYWESSDTDIVDVYYSSGDSYVGLYLGDKYGTATVTAYVYDGANWFTASCEVTVISQDKGITLDITKKTIYLTAENDQSDTKEAFNLNAYNEAGDWFTPTKVKWSTSKKAVATVTKKGLVKAVAPGKATITATGPDGSTATCKVTVKKNLIKKITGNKLITMRIGDTDYAGHYLVLKPSKLYDPTLTFTSNDDSVVSVSPDGMLKANGIGTAKITVKAQDGSKKKFTFKVKVIDARE